MKWLILIGVSTLSLLTAASSPDSVNLFAACVNGLQVDINGVATPGASVTSISWSWGDSATTIGFFPQSHTYSSLGSYIVQVTADYTDGSSASSSQIVTVAPGVLSNCVALTIAAGQGGSVSYQARVGSARVSAVSAVTLQLVLGDDLLLIAKPSTGFSFSNWSASGGVALIGGADVSTVASPSIDVIVASTASVTASFTVAAGVIYQTGFEPRTFSPGTINGQDSWLINGAPSSTVIETTTVETGVQAVGITPSGATSGVVGATRGASYNAANQILTFGIDAYLSATGTPSFWTVLDTTYNSSPPNVDFNIDQSGQIHIFIMGTDHLTGVSITRGLWNHYELDVDFFNDTVSAFYNGAPVLQGASFSSTVTALEGYAFYAQGASPYRGTDSGYFDNLYAMAIPTVNSSKVGLFRENFEFILDVNGNRQFDGTGPGQDIVINNFVPALPGDKPVVGDWNGSGTTKIGIYRPSTGQWFLDYNGNGVFDVGDKTYQFGGIAGDIPVVGDWNGSGFAKIGIFRSGFLWILDYNGNGTLDSGDQAFAYGGVVGDVPVVGDWSGDGKTKVGVVRPFQAGGTPAFWILDANNDHAVDAGDLIFAFGGITGDVAVVGDWNGSGISKAGVFRQGFFWVGDWNGSAAVTLGSSQLVAFPFGGIAGDVPVTGKW